MREKENKNYKRSNNMEHVFDTYDVKLKCTNCGATKSLYMEHCGFPNGEMLKDINAFNDKHKDCKKKVAAPLAGRIK